MTPASVPESPQPVAEADSLVGVASTDLFAVDGKTDLCLRMMVYAAFDAEHGDLTPSEVMRNLAVFFPPVTITAATKLSMDGWIPPRVDLSFYSANAESIRAGVDSETN